jgi:hypothetical protein
MRSRVSELLPQGRSEADSRSILSLTREDGEYRLWTTEPRRRLLISSSGARPLVPATKKAHLAGVIS